MELAIDPATGQVVVDRIDTQILNELANQLRIAAPNHLRLDVGRDGQVRLKQTGIFHHLVEQLTDIQITHVQFDAVGISSGQQQQLFRDVDQALNFFAHQTQPNLCLRARRQFGNAQFHMAAQNRQRRSQLMGCICRKPVGLQKTVVQSATQILKHIRECFKLLVIGIHLQGFVQVFRRQLLQVFLDVVHWLEQHHRHQPTHQQGHHHDDRCHKLHHPVADVPNFNNKTLYHLFLQHQHMTGRVLSNG